MSIGHNAATGAQIRSFVERLERLNEEKANIALDIREVLAEAKALGFDTKVLKECIKIRRTAPDDRAHFEEVLGIYLEAIGMSRGPGPLFRFSNLGAIDTAAREQVIDRMKDFVPDFGLGDIVVNMGGRPVRLVRDGTGKVKMLDAGEPKPEAPKAPPKPKAPTKEPEPGPEVDEDGALELGRQYAQDNRPVVHNPFKFGDPRRARFDEGWRKETGNDGMGPEGEE